MKFGMGSKIMSVIMVFVAVGFLSQILVVDANAAPTGYTSEQACVDASGGRGNIDAVQDACKEDVKTSCALWLGPVGNNSTTTIEVSEDYASGYIRLSAYGMCTGQTSPNLNTKAFNIRVEDDGGSIINDGGNSFERGPWGDPNGLPAFVLDIERFKDGAYREESADAIYYTRTVRIYREHCKKKELSNGVWGCVDEGDSKNYGYSNTTIVIKTPPSHYGQSWIDEVHTDITKGVDERTKEYWVRPNQTQQITFKHYLYSKSQTNNVLWAVIRNNKLNVDDAIGRGNLTSWDANGYYTLATEQKYNMTIALGSSYEAFCETLYYNLDVTSDKYTKVCGNIYVPYNFKNTISAGIESEKVYAGEKVNLSNTKVKLEEVYNSKVRQTYATKSPKTKIKVATYISGGDDSSAGYKEITSQDINLCGIFSNNDCNTVVNITDRSIDNKGENSVASGEEYNVPDVEIGNYYCVVAAVYPYTSGASTNYSDKEGNHTWYVSTPTCRQIAKRPSFQVWGGSLYSAGKIATSTTTKNNLNGVNGWGYTATGGSKNRTFGSWVELGVTSNGVVSGLASGAALGDTTDGIGGDSSNDFCKNRVPLSIANYSKNVSYCPTVPVLAPSGVYSDGSTREKLVNYIASGNTTNTNGENIILDNKNNYTEVTTESGISARYTYKKGDISIAANDISAGVTHVIRATGNVTITGDIKYDNNNKDKKYTNLSQIPKLIIYAKDIIINCNVTQVDAILIAEGNVNTCPSENYNSSTNAKRLKINGMILANSLTLNRTYGAGTGTNSKEPAEIINYDTSTVLWLNYKITSTENGGGATKNDDTKLSTTYIHELAPRY